STRSTFGREAPQTILPPHQPLMANAFPQKLTTSACAIALVKSTGHRETPVPVWENGRFLFSASDFR
ncbi:MAG: hypothetical protein LBQ81_01525, partial [Zoogloeaceae bacterium]|nr:hypothetical protein [Zoogloeaceae bacterium]